MLRLVLVLAIIAAGCVRNREPRAEGDTCRGTRYVLVSNEWVSSVEVYAYGRTGGAMRIGTVLPGTRDEFKLPRQGSAVLRTVDLSGTPIRVSPAYAQGTGVPVVMSYLCR